MSAKGRGPTSAADGHYKTPAWATTVVLKRIHSGYHTTSGRGAIGSSFLDAGCGTGAIMLAIRHFFPQASLFGVELSAKLAHRAEKILPPGHGNRIVVSDFRTWAPPGPGPLDYAVFNPPFDLAEQFALAAMRHCRTVWMLQRLNWLGGGASPKASLATRARMAFHRGHPAELLILPRRPSFVKTTKSSTDATEYAWFGWGEGARPGTFDIARAEDCLDSDEVGPALRRRGGIPGMASPSATANAGASCLSVPQANELKRIVREPQPCFGTARVRVQNTLVRIGLAKIATVVGIEKCSATQLGVEVLRAWTASHA